MNCPRCQAEEVHSEKFYVQANGKQKSEAGLWFGIAVFGFFGLCMLAIGAGCFQEDGPDSTAAVFGWLFVGLIPASFILTSKLPISRTYTCSHCGLVWSSRQLNAKEARADLAAAKILESGFTSVLSRKSHPLSPRGDLAIARNLRVGETSRHFDSDTSGSIDGWLNHSFGFHGWFIGMRTNGLGFGFGKLGLDGLSQAHLQFDSTSRQDLFSDSLMAVLERDMPQGLVDTFRVVVPSERAAREIIQGLLTDLAHSLPYETPRYRALIRFAPLFARSFDTEVSYVSDRLTALLRQAPESRSGVDIIGLLVKDHILLGGSLGFAAEGKSYSLFPLGLLQEIRGVMMDAEDERRRHLEGPPKLKITVKGNG